MANESKTMTVLVERKLAKSRWLSGPMTISLAKAKGTWVVAATHRGTGPNGSFRMPMLLPAPIHGSVEGSFGLHILLKSTKAQLPSAEKAIDWAELMSNKGKGWPLDRKSVV